MKNIEKVKIFDTTMRDGEQSPGITFDACEKMSIAKMLVKLGVDVIEAGFPINKEDFKATEVVAKNIGKIAIEQNVDIPVICGLARTKAEDIDACWQAIKDAPNKRIHTFISTSPVHMEKILKMTPCEVKQRAVDCISYAKNFTEDVEFSAMDATRSSRDFLLEVIEAVVNAGATTINIPDTVGYISPWEFQQIIARVVDQVKSINADAKVSAHCHDDLGMAVANSLSAIMGGARQIECTINGIGERAGNAALEEVVANIIARPDLYDVTIGINTKEIPIASRVVADLSGCPIANNKAVVGRNAFLHESGIHQDGVIKDPGTYELLNAEQFGRESELVIGKHSGRAALAVTISK